VLPLSNIYARFEYRPDLTRFLANSTVIILPQEQSLLKEHGLTSNPRGDDMYLIKATRGLTNMNQKYLFGTALAAITASFITFASAADVEPIPVDDWSGFFIGGHVGYGWGDSNVEREDGPPGPAGFDIDVDVEGVFAGGQLGFDFQLGSVVLGIVGDLSVSTINGDESESSSPPPAAFEIEYDWLATVRARAGWLLTDSWLLYATGGVAFADINLRGVGGAGPWSNVREDGTETGWTAGAGAEVRMTDNGSIVIEVLYMDFGSETHTPSGPPGDIDYDSELVTAKIGWNWRF